MFVTLVLLLLISGENLRPLELVSNIIFAMEDMHMLFPMDGINVSHNYSQDASKDKPLITWAIQP